MRRRQLLHEGPQLASAFIIDPELIGIDGARARVLELWQPTATVFQLPDHRWLLKLATPVETTTARGPGLTAVLDKTKRLTTSPEMPCDIEPGGIVVQGWHNGQIIRYTTADLVALDPAEWIQLSLATERFMPLGEPTGPTVAVERRPAPPVDLRSAAKVGSASSEGEEFLRGIRSQVDQGAAGSWRGRRRDGQVGRRGNAAPAGAAPQRTQPKGNTAWESMLAKMALRSPLRNEISRRHERYIDKLTRDFTSGNFNDALREAIGLAGEGTASTLSLRLPRRRQDLQISGAGTGSGRSVPWGPTIHQHLHALYKQAATDLEAQGQIDEAAFVLAELMGSSHEAVTLFERHKCYAQAALLAENRGLDGALTARLWWLAGKHDHALALAHRSGAFAAVLARIEAVSATEAHQFRMRWVDHLERGGNLLGAVEVGWEDEKIRPLLRNVIRRGIDVGGPGAPALMAYGLALDPTHEREQLIGSMLDTAGAEAVHRFALTLAALEVPASEVSRRVTSRTIRSLLPTGRGSDRSVDKAYKSLLHRCDPVLRADTPSALPAAPPSSKPLQVLAQPAGAVPIVDASAISANLILVALGEYGCRLVRPDGRTVVHWDVPTHSLVMADHGGSALLLTGRDPVIEVHRLDLTTRKVVHYGTVQSALWASTFTGSSDMRWDRGPRARDRGFHDLRCLTSRISESPCAVRSYAHC